MGNHSVPEQSGRVIDPLPARLYPSLVWVPISTPGGKGHTAATAVGRSQDIATEGHSCC